MNIIQGDVFNCSENTILHQVNCLGVMGSGVARQVKEKYPEVFNAYYRYCKTHLAKDILGDVLICEADDGKYIANLFGQIGFGSGLQTDYEAFKKAIKGFNRVATKRGLTIAIPYKIASDRGGADWNIISEIIEKYLKVPHAYYQFEKD